jgi:uncharacterized protein YcfL
MKKTILHILSLGLLVSCVSNNNQKQNASIKDSTSVKSIQHDNLLFTNDTKTDNKENARIFYRILEDTVYTYQIYKIIENKLVENELDMDYYTFHISKITIKPDTIIMIFDITGIDKGENFFIINTTHLIKNNKYYWKVFFNENFEKPYKYDLIDSLDIKKSGYFVDYDSHW